MVDQPPEVVVKFGEEGLEELRAVVAAMIASSDTESAVTRVGIVMAWHGRRGSTFTVAWASAMRSLPRDDETASWRSIFKQQKERWRDSYETRFGVASAA